MGKKFQCDKCGKKYLQRKYFNEHIKNVHSDPIIPCGFDDCGRMFKVEKDRKQHIKRCHGDKNSKCNFPDCGYETTLKQNLTRHGKVHRNVEEDGEINDDESDINDACMALEKHGQIVGHKLLKKCKDRVQKSVKEGFQILKIQQAVSEQYGHKENDVEESSEFTMDVKVEQQRYRTRSKNQSVIPAAIPAGTSRREKVHRDVEEDEETDDDESDMNDACMALEKHDRIVGHKLLKKCKDRVQKSVKEGFPILNLQQKVSEQYGHRENDVEESSEFTMDVKVEQQRYRTRSKTQSVIPAAIPAGTSRRGKVHRDVEKDEETDDDESDIIDACMALEKHDRIVGHKLLKKCVDRVQKSVKEGFSILNQQQAVSERKRNQTEFYTTPKYRKILKNVYLGGAPRENWEMEDICSCPNEKNKCNNKSCTPRLVYTECIPECGDNCRNQRIQRRQGKEDSLVVFSSGNKGLGVKTLKPINKDDFIIEYLGHVVPKKVYEERVRTIYARDEHQYSLELYKGLVIDAHRVGNESRFINHGCDPNSEMLQWDVLGVPRRVLIARRNIRAGEELSYDYNFSWYNPKKAQKCFCGSKLCRGKMVGKNIGRG